MPSKPCIQPGCPHLATRGSRCDLHQLRNGARTSARKRALQRDGYRCTATDTDGNRCTTRSQLEVHHRTALRHGGTDDERNLVTLCRTHHSALDRDGTPRL